MNRAARALTVAAALALSAAGCAKPVIGNPIAIEAPGQAELTGLAGLWEGTYLCNQGETGLRLAVDPPRAGAVTAVFEFFPLETNPKAARGKFSMIGTVINGRVLLKQHEWIEQPEGYGMVDVDLPGPVPPDAPELTGRVVFEGCTTLKLVRK
ncbi:hypothetical protein EV193_106130 [Herbihabitans rhizosphaerae]|uniref:Lipoprotein n=1 Tax=Herbihabitans rhizosphaerae TaxID=1872711 RepID=A0A4Q7KKZ4_9PSEU|nr:hypothetical protein [Herbihabitans rhizosphaerae]RZS36896.1 hypothetical protein EV193_106130 [Herbihabitans rhizosphaerae]